MCLKKIIKNRMGRLKYNYFSSNHPKSFLRGKLFKFLNQKDYEIHLITDNQNFKLKKEDFFKDGLKLYFPADSF
jgi:hypothetical protein